MYRDKCMKIFVLNLLEKKLRSNKIIKKKFQYLSNLYFYNTIALINDDRTRY